MKFVSLFFNNNWNNSDLTCICKVTHCPGPRLLFEKVNFNGQNQIVRPAHTFTQIIDNNNKHNNTSQYFIEPFLIRSMSCKRDHVWPMVSVQSTCFISFNHSCRLFYFCFCLAETAGMR